MLAGIPHWQIAIYAAYYLIGLGFLLFLAPRKTTSPVATVLFGAILLIVPIIGIVLVLILLNKQNVSRDA